MKDEFVVLRDSLCGIRVLTVPVSSDVFVLQTNASGCGISGVLSVYRDSQELPVGFYSRQLKDAETRYSATEIECLAVVEAVRHFEVYLNGRPFRVEMDHKALDISSKVLNRRLMRRVLFLQEFPMTIAYRPGTKNTNADGLSRQEWLEDQDQPPDEDV